MLFDKYLKPIAKVPVLAVQYNSPEYGEHIEMPEIWAEFLKEYETPFIVIAIDAWLKENCKHGYEHLPHYTVKFEDASDAVLFKLCWIP